MGRSPMAEAVEISHRLSLTLLLYTNRLDTPKTLDSKDYGESQNKIMCRKRIRLNYESLRQRQQKNYVLRTQELTYCVPKPQ